MNMAKRKTFNIAELLFTVNQRNLRSVCSSDTRQGWNSLLEIVLYEADAYEGFMYARAEEVPPGELPGIHWKDNRNLTANTRHSAEFPDATRRTYFVAPHLKEDYNKARDDDEHTRALGQPIPGEVNTTGEQNHE